jgi:N-acetylglutamate synthase-like GNAT family acetyltransferase
VTLDHGRAATPEQSVTGQILYRAARAEDVPQMVEVLLESMHDMHTRYGVPRATRSRDALQLIYEHIRVTGVFRVAESEGRVVAIAGAAIRDHLWFLSSFWIRPDLQRQGIGMPLVRQTWEAGAEAGATTFFTWSSPDTVALASYMKLGMLPGHGIFVFGGAPGRLPPVPASYETAPIEPRVAEELDLGVRGSRREVDHRFWSGPAGLVGRQVLRAGKVVGYYYLGEGNVGPAAWTDPDHAEAVMTLAIGEAAATSSRVGLAAPGINYPAVRFALASGLRLITVNQFLTSASFGDMGRYLPSGPLLY